MALVTITDAHLAYGHHALLDGADLAIEAGERIALIGRNGSGKSTLLRTMARLQQARGGALTLADEHAGEQVETDALALSARWRALRVRRAAIAV